MTTGYNIREGSRMLAERLDPFWGYAIVDALGEVYALRQSVDAAFTAKRQAEEYLDEARSCGHAAAPSWVSERLPFTIKTVSVSERAAALDDGTPVLDREP
jgi:hypothetical protein